MKEGLVTGAGMCFGWGRRGGGGGGGEILWKVDLLGLALVGVDFVRVDLVGLTLPHI